VAIVALTNVVAMGSEKVMWRLIVAVNAPLCHPATWRNAPCLRHSRPDQNNVCTVMAMALPSAAPATPKAGMPHSPWIRAMLQITLIGTEIR